MIKMTTQRHLLLWLKTASVVTVITGLAAGFASHPAGEGLWLLLFDILNWPLDGIPAGFDVVSRPINAVLGGVMIGWGVMMYGLLNPKIFSDGIRIVLLRGLLVWFVTDSIGSLAAEIPGNVILNLAFLGMFLPPLILLRPRHA
jgi:hypothetical protein